MSHEHITANVEIRSISDDDESSVSSFASTTEQNDTVGTLNDNELLERSGEDQVTTEEMIAEAIRGGPQLGDVSMDGCTNITIGNQTHIKGTVIIRNVLTRSVMEPIDPKSIKDNDKFGQSNSSSSSSEVSKTEEDFEYHKFKRKSSNSDSEKACCNGFHQLYRTRKRKFIILSVLIVILLIVGGAFGIMLLYSSSGNNESPIGTTTTETTNSPTSTPSSTNTLSTSTSTISSTASTITPTIPTTTPFPLEIVTRREWQKIPNNAFVKMKHPIDEIFVCHTGKLFERDFPRGCSTKEDCTKFAQKLEEYYVKEQVWDDIPYNFFLGNDQLLYEGRGWTFDGAFKSSFRGDNCLSIGFIGDYSYFMPSDTQFEIFFALIELGRELGYISQNYKIFGQCQGTSTKSPGKALFEITRSWDQWSNYSDNHVLRQCVFD